MKLLSIAIFLPRYSCAWGGETIIINDVHQPTIFPYQLLDSNKCQRSRSIARLTSLYYNHHTLGSVKQPGLFRPVLGRSIN